LVGYGSCHDGGVEADDLGEAADGDEGDLLVRQAGEVAGLEGLEVEEADPGAVLDRLERETLLDPGLVEVGAEGEGRWVPLPSDAATAGRPVAPCDDHDNPLLSFADRTVPRSGAVFASFDVGIGRSGLEGREKLTSTSGLTSASGKANVTGRGPAGGWCGQVSTDRHRFVTVRGCERP
jgi:hypothetical protein